MKMRRKIKKDFYQKPALELAEKLLSKFIIRKYKGKILEGEIIETEAYIGPQDKASHAYNWKVTPRNEVEYLEGGHIYIYLVYGMHWQLNITSGKIGYPECVLIRGLKVKEDGEKTDGPGKLCRYLKLNKGFWGEDLIKSRRIWLEERGISPKKIKRTSRIGIDYSGPYWSKRKLRFLKVA